MFSSGLKLLVVERDPIATLDLEVTLLRSGAAQVPMTGNEIEALAALAAQTFDAVLLDLKLPDDGSLKVAASQAALAIPFVLVTSYGEWPRLPIDVAARPIVRRPCSEAQLVRQLAGLLPPA